jgi:2-amino-4-hydroxy-6-hydroxymethyldihydropteridine diphosphokinase
VDTKVLKVLLLLGSNSEDAAEVLSEARAALARRALNDGAAPEPHAVAGAVAGAPITRVGSLWRTAAWGFEGPDFVNQIVEIEWNGEPKSLLLECLEVERQLGRIRPTGGPRYTSRRIDIDLILTNPFMTLADAELELPHPRMHQRRFVLQPLAEHWADWQANVLGHSVAELLFLCSDPNSVHLYSNSNKNDS